MTKGNMEITELTPGTLREAADVVEQCFKGNGNPTGWPISADGLRSYADKLEAENAEKAERDKAIEELVNDLCPHDYMSVHKRARILYAAGWRKVAG